VDGEVSRFITFSYYVHQLRCLYTGTETG